MQPFQSLNYSASSRAFADVLLLCNHVPSATASTLMVLFVVGSDMQGKSSADVDAEIEKAANVALPTPATPINVRSCGHTIIVVLCLDMLRSCREHRDASIRILPVYRCELQHLSDNITQLASHCMICSAHERYPKRDL